MNPKHTFYCPPSSVAGDVVVFPSGEAHHAVRVLRMGEGDGALVVDGRGTRHHVVLEMVTKKGVTARIRDSQTEPPPMDVSVTLAAALIKNSGRYETMLEKAAEIGADRVVPMVTQRTERTRFRSDRAESILESAMKQSGGARLPDLAPVTPFLDVLNDATVAEGAESPIRLLCHEAAPAQATLGRSVTGETTGPILLLVGPEGGFTDHEVELAAGAGFQSVSLGRSRLRAETAAIVALAIIAHQTLRF